MNIQKRKAISFKKFLQRIEKFLDINEAVTKEKTYYIYRIYTNSMLARGLNGYDAAQNKANHLRKQLG
jgi:SOS-response transcriptional repressor LexA